MKKKQTSLFDTSKYLVHSYVPAKQHGKYPLSHYSYKQRLTRLINQDNNDLSWKLIYNLLTKSGSRQKKIPKRVKTGRTFVKTVDRNKLNKAVHAMRMRRTGRSTLSVNKIAKKYKVSKPTLYRAYKKEFSKHN